MIHALEPPGFCQKAPLACMLRPWLTANNLCIEAMSHTPGMQESNADCRLHAAKALAAVMRREVGVMKAMASSSVPVALAALLDPCLAVRKAVCTALYEGCMYQALRDAIVQTQIVEMSAVLHIMQFVKGELSDAAQLDADRDKEAIGQSKALATLGLQLLGKLAHVRPKSDLRMSCVM